MGQKAEINGTGYDLKGGKTLIGGTAYAIKKGRTLIGGTGYDISLESGTPLSEIPVGNTVKIAVNGTMRDWIVVNQGIPSSSALYDDSCNGTWLLMKDSYENRWWNNSESNDYKNSSINSYLNSTFLNLFESNIKSIIQQVKIPYVNGTGGSAVASGANGLACKIFLLSGNEIGAAGSAFMPNDGAKLEYFTKTTGNDTKRIAYRNGTVSYWYLRSAQTNTTSDVFGVTSLGGVYGYPVYGGIVACDIRPAIILPFDTLVADDGTVLA